MKYCSSRGLLFFIFSLLSIFQLSVKGYSDKLHVLLKKIMEKMVTFKIDPKRYEILKELVRFVGGADNNATHI